VEISQILFSLKKLDKFENRILYNSVDGGSSYFVIKLLCYLEKLGTMDVAL